MRYDRGKMHYATLSFAPVARRKRTYDYYATGLDRINFD